MVAMNKFTINYAKSLVAAKLAETETETAAA